MAAPVARDGPQATTAPPNGAGHPPARYPAGALPQETGRLCRPFPMARRAVGTKGHRVERPRRPRVLCGRPAGSHGRAAACGRPGYR